MNSDAPASRGKMLALLRAGPFRRYIIGSVISDTGTWMQVMAQGWVMSTLTNKAILLGMVNFAAGIPTLADIIDRKSTRLNSSHRCISYAVFCLKKKNIRYPLIIVGIPDLLHQLCLERLIYHV